MATITTPATIHGTAYITGDTFRFRSLLKSASWRWVPERSAWAKDGDWIDADHAVWTVRRIGGIGNRGEFAATIEPN